MVACEAVGIAPVVPVDSQGRFTTEVPDYVGQQVFDANKPIIADLKAGTGPLARVAADQRSRRGAPRDVRALLPALLALPEPADLQGGDQLVRARERLPRPHGRAQPGHRLDAGAHQGRPVRQVARRTRATGRSAATATGARRSPCGSPTTRRTRASTSTARWRSWRRTSAGCRRTRRASRTCTGPFIDELTRPNPDDPTGRARPCAASRTCSTCGSTPGSMPFAQVHYPFENADWFEHHYPGDFIVEYIGQTRGWFYTLHVLATALFDRPAFRNVLCHGIVLGDDGRKASKSLRNFPDPAEMWDRVRLRRRALVPHVELDPARRQPHRRRGGHPRRRPPGAAAAVEHVLLLLAVRGRRGRRRRATGEAGRRRTRGDARADGPVRPGAHAGPGGDAPRSSWTPTTSRRRARACASTSTS